MNRQKLHAVAGFAPIFLSLCCTLMVVVSVAKFCAPPHLVDEDAKVHVFQLLMLAQFPAGFVFLTTKGRTPFVHLLPIIALQVFAFALTLTAQQLLTD
ncbi:MAG: hypothetical protein NVS9B12_07860 [Vulcanimicrobiaceae bacterium]